MEFDLRFTAAAVIATYAIFAALERSRSLRLRESRFLRPFFATDVGWYVVTVGVTLAFGPALQGLAQARAMLGFGGIESLDLPWVALLAIATVLYDFGTFVGHLLLHRYEVLWRLHKIHHSSRVLDWLATTRAHGLEHLFRSIPTQAVLFTLGLPTSAVAVALAIYAAFATLGHSNLHLNLARWEWLFVTPRLHRLHHVPETTQRNFGTIFTVWDRALGFLVVRDYAPAAILGVPEETASYPQSWWPQLLEPFRQRPGAPT